MILKYCLILSQKCAPVGEEPCIHVTNALFTWTHIIYKYNLMSALVFGLTLLS